MEGQWIDAWLSVIVEYLRNEKYCISSSGCWLVHGQQPPRSWSTIMIGCHYSPTSLSTAAIRIHHYQMPTRYRIHHYYHDLWFTIQHHNPQCGHSCGPGSADDKAKGLRGRSQVSNMYWWDINFFDVIRIEKRKEKLEREAPSVMCPPTF